MSASPADEPPHGDLSPGGDRACDGWRVSLVETLLILAFFFVAAGDPVPGVNEQHYLTRLKHYWDPAWCAGDLFLESPDAHLTIVLVAGWTTKFLPLSVVAWGGRLLAWTLLAWAWQRLAWAVNPRRWCSVLGAAIWCCGVRWGNFAGEWVIGGVEAKCFAYVFVLLALRAYVQDRWPFVWVHLGLATALHALVGGWSVLIMLGLWLAAGAGRPDFRSMLPALAIGGAIGLVGVAPPIVMNWHTPPEVVAEANRIYVFDRLPHHLAPLSKGFEWLLNRSLRHAHVLLVLAAATWWARRQRQADDAATRDTWARVDRLCRFAWGAVALLAIGLLIEKTFASQPLVAAKLLRYYWFRLTDVAAPLAIGIALPAFVARGMARRSGYALLLLVVTLGLLIANLGPTVVNRLKSPLPLADRRIKDHAAWRDACDWVAKNTPRDALFLVPRHANSFKWRAERAEVVNHKDIPQDAASMVEWRQRLRQVYRPPTRGETAGVRPPKRVRTLGHLGGVRLRELGEIYGADYALTTKRRRVSLPVAYENETYILYQLHPDRNRTQP